MKDIYDVFNSIVLSATIVVLIWYTIETYKLRRTAQGQLEISTLPILALEYSGPLLSIRPSGADRWNKRYFLYAPG